MKRKHFNLFLVMLLTMLSLTSCLSDGDETIALENGNAKELIKRTNWRIKGWKGNPPSGLGWEIGDIFKFEDNGSFRKWPSDSKSHHWHWIVNPKDNDTPEGINIDDYDFGWETWGPGHWTIYYPRTNPEKPIFIINLEDDPETPETPDDPMPKEYDFVKCITINRNNKEYEKYEFTYDHQGRIAKLEYTPEVISHKEVYIYTYLADSIYVTSEYGVNYYSGKLNDQGHICEAEYKDNYLKRFDDFVMNTSSTNWTYEFGYNWFNCMFQDKFKNDSNIDLNCYINEYKHYNNSKVMLLAPFGFLGNKAPFLLESISEKHSDWYCYYHDYVLDESLRVTSVVCDIMDKWENNHMFSSDTINIEYYSKVLAIAPIPGGNICYK